MLQRGSKCWINALVTSQEDICNAADSPTQLREDLRRLPQCIVMHGISDATVPWYALPPQLTPLLYTRIDQAPAFALMSVSDAYML